MRSHKNHKPRGRQRLARIHDELAKAATNRNRVLMEYRPGDGDETITYKLEPYSYRRKGSVFFGYDTMARSIKAFKVLNIVRVQQHAERFKPKWPIEIGEEKSCR